MELAFIGKLIEMYKYRKTLHELRQDLEEKVGLSGRYVHVKGKLLLDQMSNFNSTSLQSGTASRVNKMMKISSASQTRRSLKTMLRVTMLFYASANKNLICSRMSFCGKISLPISSSFKPEYQKKSYLVKVILSKTFGLIFYKQPKSCNQTKQCIQHSRYGCFFISSISAIVLTIWPSR